MKRSNYYLYFLLLFLIITSCEQEKRFPPKGYIPNTPKASQQLEAQYFWSAQDKINSSYWKDANYVDVQLKNLKIKNLYGDGYLNMTGTYNGVSDFNRGKDPQLRLKAGYDDNFLYILVEWKDTTANASFMTWKWDGPPDSHKTDSTTGWTTQKNNDNITLLFDNEASDTKDAWRWSLAYTAPFDFALNLKADGNGVLDPLDYPGKRNGDSENSRSGPNYEWNGERQDVTLPNGSVKILDPAYYLLDSNKIPVSGNISTGQTIFNNTADCKFCHGINGSGENEDYSDAVPLNSEFTNKFSREGLVDFISSSGHEGSGDQYWGHIKNDPDKIQDLLAFIRGIAGVPGYVLEKPDNQEISAISNISVGGIEYKNSTYKVLFKRQLTGNSNNDISFSPSETYTLSIQISDNDEINYIGADSIELIFKSNKL